LNQGEAVQVADKEKPHHVTLRLLLQFTMGQFSDWQALQQDEQARQGLEKILDHRMWQFEALAAAALGHYQAADAALAKIEQHYNTGLLLGQLSLMEKAFQVEKAWLQLGLLPLAPGSLVPIGPFPHSGVSSTERVRGTLEQNVQALAQLLGDVAHLRCLRGLLALERGDTEGAMSHFREAVDRLGARVHFDDRPIAERYLQLVPK
jgi:tetratricopeptide (TPR) repeat protein